MKKIINTLTILVIGLTLNSCTPNEYEPIYISNYQPVLMQYDELVKLGVSYESPKNLNQTGKIVAKNNFLYVNEPYKGVHIIDNTNPKKPIKLGFIKILGCIDLDVNGSILYVDSAQDLLAIDISDYTKPKIISRKKDVFSELDAPDQYIIENEYKSDRPANTVVIGYIAI